MPKPDPFADTTARELYELARADLLACAELLRALSSVDAARDKTKDAITMARQALGTASEAYLEASAAYLGDKAAERRKAQAARIAGAA